MRKLETKLEKVPTMQMKMEIVTTQKVDASAEADEAAGEEVRAFARHIVRPTSLKFIHVDNMSALSVSRPL